MLFKVRIILTIILKSICDRICFMPEDDDFNFKDAMRDVRPLTQDTRKPHTNKPKSPKRRSHTHPAETHHIPYEYDFSLMDQSRWVGGEDNVSFKRPGVQPKLFDRLRRGQCDYEARLDLHHFTSGEAMAMVDRCLDQCLAEGVRCVLLIHGKGFMSREQKPILKNILIQHLRENSYVLAYHSARPRDGGTGAMYVLIKASHKVKT